MNIGRCTGDVSNIHRQKNSYMSMDLFVKNLQVQKCRCIRVGTHKNLQEDCMPTNLILFSMQLCGEFMAPYT